MLTLMPAFPNAYLAPVLVNRIGCADCVRRICGAGWTGHHGRVACPADNICSDIDIPWLTCMQSRDIRCYCRLDHRRHWLGSPRSLAFEVGNLVASGELGALGCGCSLATEWLSMSQSPGDVFPSGSFWQVLGAAFVSMSIPPLSPFPTNPPGHPPANFEPGSRFGGTGGLYSAATHGIGATPSELARVESFFCAPSLSVASCDVSQKALHKGFKWFKRFKYLANIANHL